MKKEEIIEIIREELNKPLEVEIKYHDKNMPKMVKLDRGNWVDCRVIEGGKVTFNIGTPNERKEKLQWVDCERDASNCLAWEYSPHILKSFNADSVSPIEARISPN